MNTQILDSLLTTAGKAFLEREDHHFDKTYRVEYEDGSLEIFNHARCFVDTNATIIVTEHCGDYIYSHKKSGVLVILEEKYRMSPIEYSSDNLADCYEVWVPAPQADAPEATEL